MGRFTDLLLGPQSSPPAEQPKPKSDTRFNDLLFGPRQSVPPPELQAQSKPPQGKGFFDQLSDMVTGRGQKDEQLRELIEAAPQELGIEPLSTDNLRLVFAYALNVDPSGVADIATKVLPGAKRMKDSKGNEILEFGGERFFVNRPGLSRADMFKFLVDVLSFAPVARAATLVKGILTRAGIVGAGSAAVSVGQDIAAQQAGSQQGIDLERTAVAGAGGAIFEGLSGPAAKLTRLIARKASLRNLFLKDSLIDAQGRVTNQGSEALKQAGIDPSLITPKLARELNDLKSRIGAGFAEDAKAATLAKSVARQSTAEEFGISLTEGQATQNLRQIAREEAARNFARGQKAGEIVRKFDQRQAEQIAVASSRVQGGLSGAPLRTIDDPPEAAAIILDRLKGERATLESKIDAAYKAVSEKIASIDAEAVGNLPKIVEGRLRAEKISLFSETPAALRAVKAIRNFADKGGLRGVKTIKFKAFELLRREIGGLFDAAKNPSDRKALTVIKSQLDDYLDDAFDNGLFLGDPEVLDAIKEARALRTEKRLKFGARDAGDDAGRLLEKMTSSDVTNLEVANWLFGQAKVGQRGVSVRLVRRIKEVFGKDSQQFNILREGAFMRALYGSKGTPARIGPQQLKSNIDEALGPNSAEYMKEIFSTDELKTLKRLGEAIGSTITPREAANPSRSGFEAARAVEDALGKTFAIIGLSLGGPAGAAAGLAAGAARGATKAAAARRAVKGLRLPAIRSRTFTAVGTAVAAQAPQIEQTRNR